MSTLCVLAGVVFVALVIAIVAAVDVFSSPPVERDWTGWENSREDVEEYAMWSSYDERLQ